MIDYSIQYPNRKFDALFYADDDALEPRQVQAFLCANKKLRWVPEVGCSMDVGYSLFKTEKGARTALLKMARKELPEAEKRLADLRALLNERSGK